MLETYQVVESHLDLMGAGIEVGGGRVHELEHTSVRVYHRIPPLDKFEV